MTKWIQFVYLVTVDEELTDTVEVTWPENSPTPTIYEIAIAFRRWWKYEEVKKKAPRYYHIYPRYHRQGSSGALDFFWVIFEPGLDFAIHHYVYLHVSMYKKVNEGFPVVPDYLIPVVFYAMLHISDPRIGRYVTVEKEEIWAKFERWVEYLENSEEDEEDEDEIEDENENENENEDRTEDENENENENEDENSEEDEEDEDEIEDENENEDGNDYE